MKLPRIFAVLITLFIGFCVIQSFQWKTDYQNSWWQSEFLVQIGSRFNFPVILFIDSLDYLGVKGYHLPGWLASKWAVYTVFWFSLLLELAGVAWLSHRIGSVFVRIWERRTSKPVRNET